MSPGGLKWQIILHGFYLYIDSCIGTKQTMNRHYSEVSEYLKPCLVNKKVWHKVLMRLCQQIRFTARLGIMNGALDLEALAPPLTCSLRIRHYEIRIAEVPRQIDANGWIQLSAYLHSLACHLPSLETLNVVFTGTSTQPVTSELSAEMMSELSLNAVSAQMTAQSVARKLSLNVLTELWFMVIHLCHAFPAHRVTKQLINGTSLSDIPRGPRAFVFHCDICVGHTLPSHDFQTEGWQEFYDQLGSWMNVMSEAQATAPHYPIGTLSPPSPSPATAMR